MGCLAKLFERSILVLLSTFTVLHFGESSRQFPLNSDVKAYIRVAFL